MFMEGLTAVAVVGDAGADAVCWWLVYGQSGVLAVDERVVADSRKCRAAGRASDRSADRSRDSRLFGRKEGDTAGKADGLIRQCFQWYDVRRVFRRGFLCVSVFSFILLLNSFYTFSCWVDAGV